MIPKVLLLEDDSTMMTLLRTLLDFEGYDVAQTESEDDLNAIVESIRKEKPNLILLDVNLRQINGFELFQLIKQNEDLKDIQIIMTSGMDFEQRCKEEGVDGFIQKPYMPEELINKIRELCGG